MSGVFGSILNTIKGNPLGTAGVGISGLTSFLKNRQQNKYLDAQLNYQKFLSGLSTDPAKMSSYIAGFEKPLSTGLTKGVENEVQAYGAERGLSTSPQIMAEILAQALGPYQLQEQGQAITAALESLGLPFSKSIGSVPGAGPMDISALIKQLLGGGTPTPVSIGGGPSHIPSLDNTPDATPPFISDTSSIPNLWPELSGGGGGFDDSSFSGVL